MAPATRAFLPRRTCRPGLPCGGMGKVGWRGRFARHAKRCLQHMTGWTAGPSTAALAHSAGSLGRSLIADDVPLFCFSRKQIQAHPQRDTLCRFSYMLGHDLYGVTPQPAEDPAWHFNHSCDGTAAARGDRGLNGQRHNMMAEQTCLGQPHCRHIA